MPFYKIMIQTCKDSVDSKLWKPWPPAQNNTVALGGVESVS